VLLVISHCTLCKTASAAISHEICNKMEMCQNENGFLSEQLTKRNPTITTTYKKNNKKLLRKKKSLASAF